MKVCEIFTSIQGESSYAGKPCHFIRLTGCNLRCRYCDTTYSYTEGFDIDLKTLKSKIQRFRRHRLFMITGGEPLLQEETFELSAWLMKQGFKVLIETNGSQPIKTIQKHATIIMDIKTPGSGMAEFNDLTNISHIKAGDEVKFVLTDEDDYIWARNFIRQHKFKEGVEVLFSPAYKILEPQKLSGWILRDGLDVRLNVQLHKIIFGDSMRGV